MADPESIRDSSSEQGCVRAELYKEALDALDQMKEQLINDFPRNK